MLKMMMSVKILKCFIGEEMFPVEVATDMYSGTHVDVVDLV